MLSIIVPTYQRPGRLRLTLAALGTAVALEAPETEVIVVDDEGEGRAAMSIERAREARPELTPRLVETRHEGRSCARNRGAETARGDRLLFLDDDVLACPGMLRAHAAMGRAAADVVLRGTIDHLPWLAMFEDPEEGTRAADAQVTVPSRALESRRVTWSSDGWPSERLRSQSRRSRFERDLHELLATCAPHAPGRWVANTGAHFSVRRDTFLSSGGFDENLGVRWGAEDLELGFRLERAGVPLLHAVDAVVLHMDHATRHREGDHAAALAYFAEKHRMPRVLALDEYFAGRCTLRGAVAW